MIGRWRAAPDAQCDRPSAQGVTDNRGTAGFRGVGIAPEPVREEVRGRREEKEGEAQL